MGNVFDSIEHYRYRLQKHAGDSKTIRTVARRLRKKQMIVALHKRQNGKCGLCGLPISLLSDKPESKFYPTLDHIKPKSNGGVGIKHNIQLTHRFCNRAKGPIENVTIYWATKEFIRQCLEYFDRMENPFDDGDSHG